MKSPLRYQFSEYDCGPTTMLNAVSYLFEREEIPPEIIRNVMLYSLVRFGLEFLRGDYTEKVFGLFTSAQTTSIAAFTIAAFFFIGLSIYGKKPKKIRKNPR